MFWSNKIGWYEQPVVYVFYDDGTYDRFDDTYAAGDPAPSVTPPAGLQVPSLGFGKVWNEHPDVRTRLGWARAPELPGTGRFQLFERGAMIWVGQRGETYILTNDPAVYEVVSTPTF